MTELPIESEVKAETSNITVKMAGELVTVLPVKKWRSSAIRALNEGRFDEWAETSLAEDSYETWLDIDPTIEDIEDFFDQWSKASGQDQGKSGNSRRRSHNTRK